MEKLLAVAGDSVTTSTEISKSIVRFRMDPSQRRRCQPSKDTSNSPMTCGLGAAQTRQPRTRARALIAERIPSFENRLILGPAPSS